MKKEKNSKQLNVMLQPSFFEKLQKYCHEDFKTVSEVLRELAIDYVKRKEKDSKV